MGSDVKVLEMFVHVLLTMRHISRRKTFLLISLFSILVYIILFFTFNIHYYCSLSFSSFDDMSSYLVPNSPKSESLRAEVCVHRYEQHLTMEKLEWQSNISEFNLNGFSDIYLRKVLVGGKWSPPDCHSKYRVNIIVPYRQREEQLRVFISYIHQFLQHQEIEYRLIVVEQSVEKNFNRGKLFNIGFLESQKRFPSDCYIFHDVSHS